MYSPAAQYNNSMPDNPLKPQNKDLSEAFSRGPEMLALENPCPLTYIRDMRRHEVIQKLRETEPALRGFGVAALYLFGSYARDEAKSDSDVDVFVDPVPERDFGFLPFMDAYQTIQDAFGDAVEVGCSTRTGLSPYILGHVEREAVRIF
jgi:predicted nucleotidyltransferase